MVEALHGDVAFVEAHSDLSALRFVRPLNISAPASI
jgi:hypothetical protein